MPIFPTRRVLAATAFMLTIARVSAAQAGAQPALAVPFLEATGWGQVRLAPDRASVTIGVETRAPSARAASLENARIQRAVLDTLHALGFSDSSVTTRSFVVAPDFQTAGDRAARNGYVGRNVVEVNITTLSRVGEVIDAALARGATNVTNVSFSSTRADSAQLAAIAVATASAQRQAQSLATAMGGTLGPLMQATTAALRTGGLFQYALRTSAQTTGDGSSINPAPISVEASVSARWKFFGR